MVISIIQEIYNHLNLRSKIKLLLIILISLAASIAESFSLGMILPLAGSILDPNFFEISYIKYLMNFLKIDSPNELIFIIIFAFMLGIVISIIIRVFSIYYSIKVSNEIGLFLAKQIYNNTLKKEYSYHIDNNSSNVVSVLTNKIGSLTNAIFSFFIIISSAIISISILITLFFISTIITLLTLLIISIGYFIAVKLTKNKFEQNSKIVAIEHTNMIKSLQEGIGNIRNITIDKTHQKFIESYNESYKNFLFKDGNSRFLQVLPKFMLETLGVLAISSVMYFLIKLNTSNPIIIIGSLVFASQRLLPLVQQIYAGFAGILSSKESILEGMKLLNDVPEVYDTNNLNDEINFLKEIKLTNICFKYNQNDDYILENLNLKIHKGSIVGICGITGSGKSTLIDILLGLTKPNKGKLFIDDIEINNKNISNFHSLISHVPQNIFLNDGSIAKNISISEKTNNYDYKKIDEVIEKTDLRNFIEQLPNKINSLIGERGSKISGGQKQRIGIASALYKQSKILILDEATNALNKQVEEKIINALISMKNKLTIIIISHDSFALSKCDEVYELKEKKLIKKVL